ncbi:glutathione S-transferase family protein [Pseudomaricurvus alkylphenolicus]|uniref:glutathione S-transferase family protein n=1 Tax=Pseudomaricurvus alkylphenolicus TaxID=1306991 RepID=UPI001423A2C6|nr:glutathione S-transferase family protein [Pseudomaricurvus alkylphenolicus]NIB42299.1 glutathione S-transferase family protein [Pseudomaricurvus alkylphenolicus]
MSSLETLPEEITAKIAKNKGSAAGELRSYEPSARAQAIACGDLKVGPDTAENVVLYSHYASICSQRARMVLVEKQVPFKGVMLHYELGETISPTYMGINPRGLVPTIIADGEVVFDSATIMQYVNNRYAGPDLTPGDDQQKALIKQEIARADFFPIRDLVTRIGMERSATGATYSGWGAEGLKKMIGAMHEYKVKYPEFAVNYDQKIQDWMGQIERSQNPQVMENTYDYANEVMDDFDKRLQTQEFIVGNEFSLADITWVPVLIRLQYALDFKIWGDGLRPNLEQYFVSRIKTRPGFKPAIVDHYYNNVVPEGIAS